MPLTKKGKKILKNMKKTYGAEKGEKVFYASKNKGVIKNVDESEQRLSLKEQYLREEQYGNVGEDIYSLLDKISDIVVREAFEVVYNDLKLYPNNVSSINNSLKSEDMRGRLIHLGDVIIDGKKADFGFFDLIVDSVSCSIFSGCNREMEDILFRYDMSWFYKNGSTGEFSFEKQEPIPVNIGDIDVSKMRKNKSNSDLNDFLHKIPKIEGF